MDPRGDGGGFPASLELPPPIADDLPLRAPRLAPAQGRISIGYAGKIAPDWGIRELLDWTETLRAEGLDVELTIVGNKISGPRTAELRRAFRGEMLRRMSEVGVIRHEQLTRAEALARMQEMDFVWCWRPGAFERATLELSTKLVEGVASGFACICFPNETNRRLLGEDYPYFAETIEDLRRFLRGGGARGAGRHCGGMPRRAFLHHFGRAARRGARGARAPGWRRGSASRGTISSSSIPTSRGSEAGRLAGHPGRLAMGRAGGLRRSVGRGSRRPTSCSASGGLANAVWYSRNLPPGKRLFVRVHCRRSASAPGRLARQIPPDRVERFIFVSERVRDEAVRLYGWPQEKTVVIPNFVLDDEYTCRSAVRGPIRLGMVGIIPWRKRLDRAIDLAGGPHGKPGMRPSSTSRARARKTTGFMYAKGRRKELGRLRSPVRSPAAGTPTSTGR